MIVERFTVRSKVGDTYKLVEVTKAWMERYNLTGRVCTCEFGRLLTVFMDLEFETMRDLLKFWDGYDWRSPEVIEWTKRFEDLQETNPTREVLQVH
jgi:hypothetical protein